MCGGNSKVVSYKYEGAAPNAVALYHPQAINNFLMIINSQWLHFQNFSRCVCGGNSKVVSYKYEGAAPNAVALYHPGNFLTLRVAV